MFFSYYNTLQFLSRSINSCMDLFIIESIYIEQKLRRKISPQAMDASSSFTNLNRRSIQQRLNSQAMQRDGIITERQLATCTWHSGCAPSKNSPLFSQNIMFCLFHETSEVCICFDRIRILCYIILYSNRYDSFEFVRSR